MRERSVRTIAGLFEKATGQQLSEDRFWRIDVILTPFCKARGIDDLDRLAAMLERSSDPDLSLDMIDALLNNETSFFRDANVFTQIGQHILPRLAASRQETRRLRLWSAACSSGQEAYSLAMMFVADPVRWRDWKIEILGSDISRSAVAQGRGGLYSQLEVQRGLSSTQLLDWFEPIPGRGWRVKREIGSLVSFHRHNLLGPPPPGGRFDLILCRNAMIYFRPERRHQMFESLSLALSADGALLLGAGETALGISDRFLIDPDLPSVYRPAAWRGLSDAA